MAEIPSTQKPRRVSFFLAGAATALALVGGAMAYAQHSAGHGHMGGMAATMHLDHVQATLTRIGASDAQKSQIDSILKGAMNDLKTAHGNHFAALEQLHQLLLAPNVDRTQIEALRAAQMKMVDDESKRVLDAFVNAAQVLTPEQRAALTQDIRNHQGG